MTRPSSPLLCANTATGLGIPGGQLAGANGAPWTIPDTNPEYLGLELVCKTPSWELARPQVGAGS